MYVPQVARGGVLTLENLRVVNGGSVRHGGCVQVRSGGFVKATHSEFIGCAAKSAGERHGHTHSALPSHRAPPLGAQLTLCTVRVAQAR